MRRAWTSHPLLGLFRCGARANSRERPEPWCVNSASSASASRIPWRRINSKLDVRQLLSFPGSDAHRSARHRWLPAVTPASAPSKAPACGEGAASRFFARGSPSESQARHVEAAGDHSGRQQGQKECESRHRGILAGDCAKTRHSHKTYPQDKPGFCISPRSARRCRPPPGELAGGPAVPGGRRHAGEQRPAESRVSRPVAGPGGGSAVRSGAEGRL